MRLIYYPARGCCEPIRMLLAWADVPCAEVNVSGSEFALVKPVMALDVLPALEDGALTLHHHRVVLRYLARKYGLEGSSAREAALCDMWHEHIDLLVQSIWQNEWDPPDTASGRAARATYFRDVVRPGLARINEGLSYQAGPYLVGAGLTYVDLVCKAAVDTIERELPDASVRVVCMSDYGLLDAHYRGVQTALERRSPKARGATR